MPKFVQPRDERLAVQRLARQLLIEELTSLGWIAGRVDIVDFLNYTWDLDNMPSTDPRFSTAAGDVWQHMVNNDDWDINYLFGSYLGLYDAPDEIFFRFLESTVNPLIRNTEEQPKYVEAINKFLASGGNKLEVREEVSGHKLFRVVRVQVGVSGKVKNLIFAAKDLKPRIILIDAINNDIKITQNEENCLVYDRPIPQTGLTWADLVDWWTSEIGEERPSIDVERRLFVRLFESLDKESKPEQLLFKTYFEKLRPLLEGRLPALIPQVYLHYDPYTIKELGNNQQLIRQRMDFLILFSDQERVVIEVDGKQHYSDAKDTASPKKYAEMVKEDRRLKLSGYDVYRFGGYELYGQKGKELVHEFFVRLFKKHSISLPLKRN